MAVAWGPDSIHARPNMTAGDNCFYCYEQMSYPAICWQSEALIWLHPACALDLCIRLMLDIYAVSREKPLTISALRRDLEWEEHRTT